MDELRRGVVVLAAGGSSRLGHPKQLVEIDGMPLVRRAARCALDAGIGPVSITVGSHEVDVRSALDGVGVQMLINSDWRSGMSGSVRTGVLWARSLGLVAALFMLADTPYVTAKHIRELSSTLIRSGALAVGTGYDGVAGVPAAFDCSLFDRLLALDGDRGARDVLRDPALRVAIVPFEQAGLDIDLPSDLSRRNLDSQ